MREPTEVEPAPRGAEEIMRFGLLELALMATGSHQDDPCYGERRRIKDYARRILAAAGRPL